MEKRTSTAWINLVVALSNVAGIPAIMVATDTTTKVVIFYGVVFSFFMHMSETGHNLTGIYPFNTLAYEFLWCDRVTSSMTAFYITYFFPTAFSPINLVLAFYSSIILYASERMTHDPSSFAFLHCFWHIAIFLTLYLIVK